VRQLSGPRGHQVAEHRADQSVDTEQAGHAAAAGVRWSAAAPGSHRSAAAAGPHAQVQQRPQRLGGGDAAPPAQVAPHGRQRHRHAERRGDRLLDHRGRRVRGKHQRLQRGQHGRRRLSRQDAQAHSVRSAV